MRLGVLDVGSNTVHLLVVDAHPGAPPLAAYSHRMRLRLAEQLEDDGSISRKGADQLVAFCLEAVDVADDQGVEQMLAFATSAIREAPNGEDVLARVRDEAGVALTVLSGGDEARLTFLAVRRWFGWSAGRLVDLDIGGGSLEISAGAEEEPAVAVSVPLGAGRVTRDRLRGDPPSPEDVKAARKHIRAELGKVVRDVLVVGTPDRVVGTSKTFRSLARLCGAAPYADGPYVRRVLERDALAEWAEERLPTMSVRRRCALPGVSEDRAPQLLAGAMVALAAMDLLGVQELDICPWALREGILLRRLDALPTT
ncbi:Ppx/GppA phosphatase family protein [Motilibacter aurantiacus]|uniref:Ppx/GppA phosphatase family protein n=1 Tax=Motilibacter aurantiacus TaxID=2714955 RepID=UPI00140BC0FE|nr:Ppx/GppA family phosphatase [Motilibacter aurantiacus]